jgi:hypothetical protein
MNRGSRPAWLVAASCLLCLLALAVVPPITRQLLRAAGWALVAEDSVAPADVIVIAVDADGAGVLEASDLTRRGLSRRVAVFSDPPSPVDREFLRRGVPYFNAAARSIEQLHALGVGSTEEIERTVVGTTDEGRILPGWCHSHHYRTVIFVSTADHSRRTRRMLKRAMQGSGATVRLRYSRYSQFDPDSWWRFRDEARAGVVEMQKLLADVLLHPLT